MNYVNVFTVAVYCMMISWLAFSLVWIVLYINNYIKRKKGNLKTEIRHPKSWLGLLLQAIGMGIIFSIRRDIQLSVEYPGMVHYWLTVVSVFIGPVSAFISIYAVFTLGKQWSFGARIITNHQLIVKGPYRFVRHPIYLAFFGLFISTGFLITNLMALLIAIIFFSYGTILRIHAEEELLIGQFRDRYLEYCEKVRAIIPFIY